MKYAEFLISLTTRSIRAFRGTIPADFISFRCFCPSITTTCIGPLVAASTSQDTPTRRLAATLSCHLDILPGGFGLPTEVWSSL